ncbi:carboxypeptidase-like regulatory domain-containing protein [Winogradskyella forsetii]|uniref:carboxypeptidase-like regulatory domain-containing protein n=1 Tax=Winogradskyella forsetii TaxID=2686077 RepID=UPI0015B8D72B|nr:carboxypeptidase-like regulatory domain-containing protein [Winogradskyella forsetii]
MKSTLQVLLALMFCAYSSYHKTDPVKPTEVDDLNKSGYAFDVNVVRINSEYSEFACSMFREKLVIVSSKTIGAFGPGIDSKTNEPFTDLYYLDVGKNGNFSRTSWFSRILNTKANEGQVAFSKDENTIYYTRSDIHNTSNYKLYKAELRRNAPGKWFDELELAISSNDYSVESPHVSADGKFLYFSSNMEGGFGGFDIYMARIYKDGGIGTPVNLGNKINSIEDEKYPFTSKDNKELYFSSTGHESMGGYDIFISNRLDGVYTAPRNLGRAVNSDKDEIAFVMINTKSGVFSSNKAKKSNTYNMYHFEAKMLYKELQGVITTEDRKILPNVTVVLLNSEGQEIERQKTNVDAAYHFKIKPFENYQIIAEKEGFENYTLDLKPSANSQHSVLKMQPKVEVSYNKVKH